MSIVQLINNGLEQQLNENYLIEMANMTGKFVKTDDINFSFHFSDKDEVHLQHGIRVKINWNKDKSSSNFDGTLALHGDYRYTPSSHPKNNCTTSLLKEARNFFKKYKVLFAAVWEGILDPNFVHEYFKGEMSLYEVVAQLELPDDVYYKVNFNFIDYNNLTELENRVRKYGAFNMND